MKAVSVASSSASYVALLVRPSFIAHMNYHWIRVTSCRINHSLSALLIPSLRITIFFGYKVNFQKNVKDVTKMLKNDKDSR